MEVLDDKKERVIHVRHLSCALEEAERALHEQNFPVGAVLVGETGEVIASTHNTVYSHKGYMNHAEAALILMNQSYLFENQRTATLYTSLEPCVMCLGAALISRLRRIVWAADDLWAGGIHSYNFSSKYLSSQKCIFIPPFSTSLQRKSLELIEAYLLSRNPKILKLIKGEG